MSDKIGSVSPRIWSGGAGAFFLALLLSAAPACAQDADQEPDLPPIDESEFFDDNSQQGLDQDFESGDGDYYEADEGIPTAVIEGVQVSSEPGGRPDEKLITAYFIFRDKPSSYFYEVKVKEKKVIFEFNDTKTSGAPVESVSEPPIKGFTVEDRKINVNKDIKGLRPEYHSQIRVVFSVDAVPDIHVTDEYNVISFSYKWTTDSSKLDQYVIKPPQKWPWLVGTGTVLAGGGIAYWWFTRPAPETPLGELSTDNLPVHINQ
ncbi:MAG: hypothetical protein JXA71_14660 [Chitinispirillaceae bacterium]|nr:hypothetical protein [Chitinispirillaceae bacterium]